MALGREDGYRVSEIEQIDNEREDALKNNNGFSEDQSDYDGDQFDLDARLSLTRVPGMSTDLSDISEVEYRQLRLERVVLGTSGAVFGVDSGNCRRRRERYGGAESPC